MNDIKLATAGAGYFSQFQYEAWQRIPEIALVAICNRSHANAESIATQYGISAIYTDFSDMLHQEKPDLVDIITPPETHLEYIREAVKHKTNIICQKPFCTSLEEAKIATALAKEAGILLVVHENFRFQPWYKHINQHLQSNSLGELYQAHFRFRPGDGQGATAYLERQPYFQKMKQFMVHETAIHWVDTFRYLFGEIHSVYAQLRKLNPVIAGEDSGIIIFEFKSGFQAIFDGNRLSDHNANNSRLTMGEMTIEGSAATLHLNGNAEIMIRQHGQQMLETQEYSWENIGFGGDCAYHLQKHVVEHIQGKAFIANTAEDYILNLKVEQAIYTSAQENTMVVVEY